MKITRTRHLARLTLLPWILTGLGAGVLNGLLGAAGGILLVSVLPYLTPPAGFTLAPSPFAEQRDVLATSLCVMIPVTLLSTLLYILQGNGTSPKLATVIAIPSMLGGLLGAYLLGRLPRNLLRKLFGLLVAVAGVRMILG